MDQNAPSQMDWQAGDFAVSRLLPHVELRVDYEALSRLQGTLGPKLAAATLAQAHDDLALRLRAMTVAHANCSFDAMAVAARRIRRVSAEIGLPELRRAADHVIDCLTVNDATALAATVTRLGRIGDLALTQVEQLRLPSG